MKFICSYAGKCDDETCPHHGSHESGPGCDCTRCKFLGVEDAKCVMDVASLPVYKQTGTIAIMIHRRGRDEDVA